MSTGLDKGLYWFVGAKFWGFGKQEIASVTPGPGQTNLVGSVLPNITDSGVVKSYSPEGPVEAASSQVSTDYVQAPLARNGTVLTILARCMAISQPWTFIPLVGFAGLADQELDAVSGGNTAKLRSAPSASFTSIGQAASSHRSVFFLDRALRALVGSQPPSIMLRARFIPSAKSSFIFAVANSHSACATELPIASARNPAAYATVR